MTHKELSTNASFILRLRNPDDADAWSEFVEIYEPLIYGLIRSRGFQHADAAELTQDVMMVVVRAVGGWNPDPARGSFRGWLATIARNLMLNFLAGPRSRFVGSGRSRVVALLRELPDDRPQESQICDLELKRRLFVRAADVVRQQVQPTSWQAFWKTAVERRSVNVVA